MSDAHSPVEDFHEREYTPQSGPINEEDHNSVKEELNSKSSYRSETLDDMKEDIGPGLGRHIILQRNDNTPTRSTWIFVDTMMANQGLRNDLTFLIPNSDQHPWSPPEGFIFLYESFFTASGLWFPLPTVLVDYCLYRKIVISQLNHAAICNFVSVLALSAEAGLDIDRRFFEEMSSFKRCKDDSGRFYVSMKSNYNLLLDTPSKISDWEMCYFVVKNDGSRFATHLRNSGLDGTLILVAFSPLCLYCGALD